MSDFVKEQQIAQQLVQIAEQAIASRSTVAKVVGNKVFFQQGQSAIEMPLFFTSQTTSQNVRAR